MSFKNVDHIAIAVPDLDVAISLYKTLLGKEPSSIEEVTDQKVKAAFFSVGETNLELLFPISNDSPISSFLEQRKGKSGLHHIALRVENIEKHLAKLKADGIQLIDEVPRIGAHGKKIAFIHPKSTGGILIELTEII